MSKRWLWLLFTVLLLAGCTRSPQPAAPPPVVPPAAAPAFVTLPAAEAIPQMIAAERDASRTGDLALLAPCEEVAQAIVWLLSDDSSYTTGAVIDVTGGR